MEIFLFMQDKEVKYAPAIHNIHKLYKIHYYLINPCLAFTKRTMEKPFFPPLVSGKTNGWEAKKPGGMIGHVLILSYCTESRT